MRNQPLLDMLQDLRAEIGDSQNPAHNAAAREVHVRALRRTQEILWGRYDWPFLRVERFVDVQAGQRFYALPPDLSAERLETVEVHYGGHWCKLHPGITPGAYAYSNSYAGGESWPVQCWRLTDSDQIELWPVPDKNATITADDLDGRLRITGIRNLRPLVSDDNRSDLDGTMIVLFTAADILAGRKSPAAPAKADMAGQLYRTAIANYSKSKTFRMFGASSEGHMPPPPPKIVQN